MRELASREYTATLSYAAAILFFVQFLLAFVLGEPVAASGVHLLFVAVLVLIVLRVDAPPWARLSGYGWAALGVLADVLLLGAAVFGGSFEPGLTLAALALLPGAAWVVGASLSDPGAGRALGVAAAAGMAFSALLTLTDRLVLVDSPLIVRLVSQLTLALVIAWFAVLGRDLDAGRRHWGGARPMR